MSGKAETGEKRPTAGGCEALLHRIRGRVRETRRHRPGGGLRLRRGGRAAYAASHGPRHQADPAAGATLRDAFPGFRESGASCSRVRSRSATEGYASRSSAGDGPSSSCTGSAPMVVRGGPSPNGSPRKTRGGNAGCPTCRGEVLRRPGRNSRTRWRRKCAGFETCWGNSRRTGPDRDSSPGTRRVRPSRSHSRGRNLPSPGSCSRIRSRRTSAGRPYCAS